MPRFVRAGALVLAIAGLACLIAAPAAAQRRGGGSRGGGSSGGGGSFSGGTFADRTVPGARQAEIHNPYSSRYVDMLPGGFDRRNPGGGSDGGSFGGGFGHGHHHGGSSWSPVFIPYAVPWSGYGSGPYYGPFGYGGWLPPVVLPAETLYGPQALTRFVGFDPPPDILANVNPAPVAPAAPQPGGFGQLAPGNVDLPERAKVRASNDESRARARKYIGFGDEHFRKQRFADAVQRYRSAIDAAPDVADAYFRQALSLAAMGRYETAVKAIERGLDVAPDWPRSGFRIDVLYGDNQLAKAAHLDALAKAAAADPNDPNLMFLLGVYLYCDGQAERSRPFFLRARDLGLENRYTAAFLTAMAPAANGPNAAPAPNGAKPPAVGVEI